MTVGATPILIYGGMFLLVGILALTLIVRRDLVPVPVLGEGSRYILGFAIGSGLLTFAIKLSVVALMATFPSQVIEGYRTKAKAATVATAAVAPSPPPEPDEPLQPLWRALPRVAPAPADNPTTPEKVRLGKRLFHDPRLSLDGTVSCASCHDLTLAGGADGRATALGVDGQTGTRNAPTVFNAAFQARLFWDGRARSLEEQAAGPLTNPVEMAMPSLDLVAERVRADPAYGPAFRAAFGADAVISGDAVVKALAAYERTLITPDAPYDRFVRGEADALDDQQKRGMWLFRTLGCANCHSGPNFSGASLVGPQTPYMPLLVTRSARARSHGLGADKGRAAEGADIGIWRVPSLRNVAVTGPYFHNGAVSDLSEAVRVMAEAQLGARLGEGTTADDLSLSWSPEAGAFSAGRHKRVTERDIADIVAFLHALTGRDLARRSVAAKGE